jgi:hypothetical protein
VNPGAALHRKVINKVEDGVAHLLPTEIRFIAREKEELGPQLVFDEVEREPWRLVRGQRRFLEVKERATSSVVNQQVVDESPHTLSLEGFKHVLIDLADSSTCIGKAGESRDKGKPARNVREFHRLTKNFISEHTPMLASAL